MSLNNMENSFDTWDLRNDAKFNTLIAKDLYWVPFSSLGKTRYTNSQIQNIIDLSVQNQRSHIANLFEAVQLFQNLKFNISSDKPYFMTSDGLKWQYQFSPEQSSKLRTGSCCEMASWLYYFAESFFDESGYILIERPQNGHVMNYFRNGNDYYFVDMETHHPKYKHKVLKETGRREDFYKAVFFTSALLKSASIKSFISYYRKVIALAKTDFAFYRISGGFIPPIACDSIGNEKRVYISKTYNFEQLNTAKNIKTIYIDYNPEMYLPI